MQTVGTTYNAVSSFIKAITDAQWLVLKLYRIQWETRRFEDFQDKLTEWAESEQFSSQECEVDRELLKHWKILCTGVKLGQMHTCLLGPTPSGNDMIETVCIELNNAMLSVADIRYVKYSGISFLVWNCFAIPVGCEYYKNDKVFLIPSKYIYKAPSELLRDARELHAREVIRDDHTCMNRGDIAAFDWENWAKVDNIKLLTAVEKWLQSTTNPKNVTDRLSLCAFKAIVDGVKQCTLRNGLLDGGAYNNVSPDIQTAGIDRGMQQLAQFRLLEIGAKKFILWLKHGREAEIRKNTKIMHAFGPLYQVPYALIDSAQPFPADFGVEDEFPGIGNKEEHCTR